MAWISEIFFFLIRQFLYRKAVNRAKKEGLLFYLKALQVIRKSILGSLGLVFAFQMLIFGFVGVITVGVLLLPQDTDFKLWLLFGIFSALFVIPAFILSVALSEKVWFRISGAEKMMSDLTSYESDENLPRAS